MRNQSQLPKSQTLTVMPKVKRPASRASLFLGADMSYEQSVCEMVNSIMTLAVLNSDALHIHIKYSPHVKSLNIYVNDSKTDYQAKGYSNLMDEHICLNESSSLEELKLLEDKLIELVADAKDLAIGAC